MNTGTLTGIGANPSTESSGKVLGELMLKGSAGAIGAPSFFNIGKEEWLRTGGFYVTYSQKYAKLKVTNDYSLFANSVAQASSSSLTYNVPSNDYTPRMWFFGGTYFAAPGGVASEVFKFTTLGGPTSSVGTTSGSANIYDSFLITSGANAGRLLVSTANAAGGIQYTTGSGYTAVNLGVVTGRVGGKPDGSLLVATSVAPGDVLSNAAGTLYSSVNSGASWSSRTAAGLGSNARGLQIIWSPVLNKIVLATYSGGTNDLISSADGITWAAEGAGIKIISTQAIFIGNVLADNGTALLCVGAAGTYWRYISGAWTSFASPNGETLHAFFVNSLNQFYAYTNSGGVYISYDNGLTFNVVSRNTNLGIHSHSPSIANDRIFFSSSSPANVLYHTTPNPVNPDLVGYKTTVSVGTTSNIITYVRIA